MKEKELLNKYKRALRTALRSYMREHNLTKGGLTKKLGLSDGQLHNWLAGKTNLTLQSMVLIETKLGIKLLNL